VTNDALARSYLQKARVRLEVLALLERKHAWSDVVRESQEVVELALKAMLREIGVEPPKWHDVGGFLKEHRGRLTAATQSHVDRLADVSAWLRKEREFAFYGDVDLIPTEAYTQADAARAIADATVVVQVVAAEIDR
jgi:HEPN domain-containing protein